MGGMQSVYSTSYQEMNWKRERMISIGDDCVVAGKIAALQSLEVVHGGLISIRFVVRFACGRSDVPERSSPPAFLSG